VNRLDMVTVASTLRAQGMPPAEVREVLIADPAMVRRYLELHAERLEEQAAQQRAVLARMRDYLLASCEAIGA